MWVELMDTFPFAGLSHTPSKYEGSEHDNTEIQHWTFNQKPFRRHYNRGFEPPHNIQPVVSLSKKLYHYGLVLVDPRSGFERDFTMELN